MNDDNMFDYGDNIRMGNNTKTLNITSNNNLIPLNYSTMSQHNQVIYIAKIAFIARFTSLTNVFMA